MYCPVINIPSLSCHHPATPHITGVPCITLHMQILGTTHFYFISDISNIHWPGVATNYKQPRWIKLWHLVLLHLLHLRWQFKRYIHLQYKSKAHTIESPPLAQQVSHMSSGQGGEWCLCWRAGAGWAGARGCAVWPQAGEMRSPAPDM